MSAEDVTKYRLDSIERSVKDLAEASKKFAEQQALMNADIRILVKEQMRLTKTLNGVASFQSDVRSLHSTMQRWFSRVERLERDVVGLRNDFNVFQAREDGKNSVFNWLSDHWQLVLILSGGLAYLWLTLRGLFG